MRKMNRVGDLSGYREPRGHYPVHGDLINEGMKMSKQESIRVLFKEVVCDT